MRNDTICKLNVLITSPSIYTSEHIGGIATFTNLLIENNPEIHYIHFERGRKNNQKRGIAWFVRQPKIYLDFISVLKNKNLTVIHINMPLDIYSIIRDTLLVSISFIFGKKIISHLHGGKYSMKRSIPLILKLLVKQSFLMSDIIISLGYSEKQFLCDFYKINPVKVHALHNAVKIPDNVNSKPTFSSTVNLLFMGRIEKNKGLTEIIQALKLLNNEYDFKLIAAGEGPDKEWFIHDCTTLLPGKFEYLGVVSGREKQIAFEKSHIFLMPSYYEGLPYSLLEAMSNRLVPIVTPVGSVPEIVEDGTNGFIVQIHDYISIYKKTAELIKNPGLMQIMCSNAFDIIKSKYSLSNHITEINKIYYGLAG